MLTDPGLRDELDRVAAAVGVRVVHLGGRHPVSRKTWSAAAAVVLDHAGSTVEYAIGTIAAAAFGAILYTVVTGDSIVSALNRIIGRALSTKV